MVTTTSLGKVAFMPKGNWSSTSTYSYLEVVTNNGNSYVAKQNVPSGVELNDDTYWQLIAGKGDIGPTGNLGPTGPTGNVYYASFEVNLQTGKLLMHTNENYEGPMFSLDNGNLKLEVA